MARDPERITYFGATDYRNKRTPFGIKAKDRSKHMYVIGKTGMGKSTLLENMAIQDIQNGEGVAFIDPHGSSAEKLLDYVPQNRIDEVLYFAPFDMEWPVAFNIMEDVGYDKRHLVVASLMSSFKKLWPDVWSSRMEYILENTLLALLEYPDATMLDINRMLINKEFRKKVVDNIKDPVVKAFWTEEFATYTDRYTQEATPAIQNKIGQFTSNPLIRNIIGQPKSSFDMRKLMDEGKLFIANISKGRMGEKNAQLLGSIVTTKVYLSAMSRAEESAQIQSSLPDFYFYVDEFQSIANETFADILSEARKYKLNLIIAHQYVAQMEDEVRDAVFGNVGTTVVFRVGPFDAEALETLFKPFFMMEDLVNLNFTQVYLTLMIDGVGSQPFSAVSLPPIEPPRISHREAVLSASRQQYGNHRDEVEKIVRERGFTEEKLVTNPDLRRDPEGKKHKEQQARHQQKQLTDRSKREGGSNRPSERLRPSAPRKEFPQKEKPQEKTRDEAKEENRPQRQHPSSEKEEAPNMALKEALAMALKEKGGAESQDEDPHTRKQKDVRGEKRKSSQSSQEQSTPSNKKTEGGQENREVTVEELRRVIEGKK